MVHYKNKFKVKADNSGDLKRLVELYGGVIETDSKLFRNEYWYCTDCEKEILQNSILIELLN